MNQTLNDSAVQVLLIEDNPAEARLVEEMMRDAGDHWFEVRWATNLSDGLRLAAQADIILLDLSLPDTDGLDTFSEACTRTQRPIVVVTGHDDEFVAVRAVADGAQDYLVKGRFDGDDLVRSVRYAISRHRLTCQQQSVEKALRESEERYRRFFEEDLTGDCFLLPDGQILDCNPAFAKIFGFATRAEAQTVRLDELLSRSRLHTLLERLRAEGRVERFEIRGNRRDGRPVFIVGNAVASLDESGDLTDFRVYLFDDTERQQAEDQLLQAQKMEAVGRLAGGVAHDFSNILTAVTFHAEYLLARLGPDPSLRSRAEYIKEASQQAATLTSQLLAFSSRQVLRPKILDLNAAVRQVKSLFQRIIGEDIEVAENLSPGIGRIRADPSQLEQVVLNLVVNARDAMPRGGRLELETRELTTTEAAEAVLPTDGPFVALRVSDTGEGMDVETQANIFEPFFTTKERGKGTGLGLSTVYGIVKQSHGHIIVDSEPGRGTAFEIFFPRVQDSASNTESKSPAADEAGGSENVLVVEDEDALRGLILEALALQGYSTFEANSGEQALELGKEHSAEIDLAIIDMVMPDIRGPELIEKLRLRHPELKFLCMSGYVDNTTVRQDSAMEKVPFIEKPFSPADLAQKVRVVLDQTAASADTSLAIDV